MGRRRTDPEPERPYGNRLGCKDGGKIQTVTFSFYPLVMREGWQGHNGHQIAIQRTWQAPPFNGRQLENLPAVGIEPATD